MGVAILPFCAVYQVKQLLNKKM